MWAHCGACLGVCGFWPRPLRTGCLSWKLRCAVAGGLCGRAAAFFFAGKLAEEAAEEFFGEEPVVAVDAVLHLRRLHYALYEPRRLEFLEVLRHGVLRDGQFFVENRIVR